MDAEFPSIRTSLSSIAAVVDVLIGTLSVYSGTIQQDVFAWLPCQRRALAVRRVAFGLVSPYQP